MNHPLDFASREGDRQAAMSWTRESGDRSRRALYEPRSEGNEGEPHMSLLIRRRLRRSAAAFLFLCGVSSAFAAEVHGRVTDALGVPVAGEEVALI